MLDCVIRGGTVIDGTGSAGIRADVGIRDGKIAAIGKVDESATRTIDAEGRVVAPGFIDVHTHVDAQIMWEPGLTPSSLHGVTTMLGGNCGFTICPIDDSSADYVMRMLATVEGMPVELLQSALKFDWKTYAEWTAKLEGKAGLNCGFLAGHSTIRRLVMGEDWKQPATDAQINRMAELVEETVSAGALGFSSSWNEIHGDHLGNPVPSRFAEPDELVRLAAVLRDHPGTMLEFQPGVWPRFSDRAIKVMSDMSIAADKPLNWNVITVGTGVSNDDNLQRLSSFDYAAERGGRVIGLILPVQQRVHIVPLTAIFFNSLPNWAEVFEKPVEERMRSLADPATRAKLAEGLFGRETRHVYKFPEMTVESVVDPALKPLEGRLLADIAAERGCTALEAFFDVSIADRLRVCFVTGDVGNDEESWNQRKAFWSDKRALIGASDAGAHLESLDVFTYVTDFVGPTVRDRKLLSLQEAVYRLTDQPARFYGLKGRGRLTPGWQADIVIFDPATVRPGKVGMRPDLPAAQSRMYAPAIGIDRTLVNGVEVVVAGKVTGAVPGTVLRSGRDTAEGA